jgi:AcrR family transcriptional regulator
MSRDDGHNGGSRRDQHAEDTRRAILRSSRDAFAHKGYAATSLDEICTAAQLTKGALYHHFKNKAALLEAVYVEMEEELTSGVRAAVDAAAAAEDADESAWGRIAVALDAFLEGSAEPAYVRIVLREAPSVLGTRHGRALDHAIGLGFVTELLGGMREQGMLPDIPIETASRVLLAAASEVAVSMAYSNDPETARREGTAVLLALFEGLALKARDGGS